MLTVRVIPCLDIRDGRVVKGVNFAGLRDAGDPVQCARAYEAQGADEIVFLDVAATPRGRAAGRETIRIVRAALSIPLTVGGGVGSVEDAQRLLEAGADKVAVNTAAVARPRLLAELAARFGRQCIVLAIDAASLSSERWEVLVRSGSERSGRDVVEWAGEGVFQGAGEILLTSFDRDGTRLGYDLALIERIAEVVRVPVIASGGAASAADLIAAVRSGADAVLAASIFHDGELSVATVKHRMAAAGLEMRL